MPSISGPIDKMIASYTHIVHYSFVAGDNVVSLNEYLGHKIKIDYLHKILCVSCGKLTKKSFGQGFCYNCFVSAPDNAECIIHPEQCRAHLGLGRDPEWEERNHNQPHHVYLSYTSNVKVGVTRNTQIPIRWIDQGATQAIVIANVPYRYLAGVMEVTLKEKFNDKTNWKRMLLNDGNNDIDLISFRDDIYNSIDEAFEPYMDSSSLPMHIKYPMLVQPTNIENLSLEKQSIVEGVLTGIKGQYLIINNKQVINIRTFSGYYVQLDIL